MVQSRTYTTENSLATLTLVRIWGGPDLIKQRPCFRSSSEMRREVNVACYQDKDETVGSIFSIQTDKTNFSVAALFLS